MFDLGIKLQLTLIYNCSYFFPFLVWSSYSWWIQIMFYSKDWLSSNKKVSLLLILIFVTSISSLSNWILFWKMVIPSLGRKSIDNWLFSLQRLIWHIYTKSFENYFLILYLCIFCVTVVCSSVYRYARRQHCFWEKRLWWRGASGVSYQWRWLYCIIDFNL